jgi:hypothetical protein
MGHDGLLRKETLMRSRRRSEKGIVAEITQGPFPEHERPKGEGCE